MEASDVNHPGTFIGADVDLANALAKAMHLSGARIVSTSFDSLIPALARHNFDVIMSSMNDTPGRRKQISFIDYMQLRAAEAIVVPKAVRCMPTATTDCVGIACPSRRAQQNLAI
jgi:polar amino acid transport system substrate-binding protein